MRRATRRGLTPYLSAAAPALNERLRAPGAPWRRSAAATRINAAVRFPMRPRLSTGRSRPVDKKSLTIKKLEPAPIEKSSSPFSAPAFAASGPEAPGFCVFAATLGKINIHFARKAAEAPFQP
jgi:hypothetical protein